MLICAATRFELNAYGNEREAIPGRDSGGARFLVTGVGIPAALGTLYPHLAALSPKPALILNIGIAGAYPGSGIKIGDLVIADGEVYGDVGMELPDEAAAGFLPLSQTDFGRKFYAAPFPTAQPPEFFARDVPGVYRVHVARGCTVNACAGTEATGKRRERLFSAGFETMEGAAVAQAGRAFGVPVCEVRAISNIAAARDMRPVNIRRALDNLAAYLRVCRGANAEKSRDET